jgi:hypothetical protein
MRAITMSISLKTERHRYLLPNPNPNHYLFSCNFSAFTLGVVSPIRLGM